MARTLTWLTTLLLSGCTRLAYAEPITISGPLPANLRNDGDGWRPVRDSVKHQFHLPLPTSAYYVELGVNNKYFRVDPSPSNKVEIFAPAPPSILGTFSGFGHDTIKSRNPVKHKKPFKETFQQAESRPGYPTGLLATPHRHVFPQPFKQNDNIGQAYYFEASLSPPPRESAINFVPPPSSKGLAPNSYYLQFDQQTRAKPTSSSFSPYLRQNLPVYGVPDHVKSTNPSTDSYRFYSPEPPRNLQFNSRPSNSHGRPPGIDYFGNYPFGDIHLNTNRPENKTPAKDIYDQLSHLGRPFQSSTVDPPRFSSITSDYSTLTPLEFFSTPGTTVHQTTLRPFRPSPLILDPFPTTERPTMFVTPGPSPPLREVYPIPVTTLDIPSRDEYFNNKPSLLVNTYQSIPETQQYSEEVTLKPTTTTHKKRPEVEVNTDGQSYYQPTPFLPTPSTDMESPINGPVSTEFVKPFSETNEVQKPTRTRISRPRYRKKKPTRKPELHYFVETTTEHNFETPFNEYTSNNEDHVKLTTLDTLQNNYQTEKEHQRENVRYEDKFKRRRPVRPNTYHSTSTFTNTEAGVQEVPTAFSTLPEEDVKTTVPSSTTTFNKVQQRRRKKPSNKYRGSIRNGLTRSTTTTTTTTEPPQDLTSDVFTYTDDQNLRETTVAENYPFNGLSFNEYGHIMQTGTDDYNVNTLFPTQQIDEYQTNFHEDEFVTTTITTTEPTTTTTTTTMTPILDTTTPTSTIKPRIRNKYTYNNSRPRFSVKDYRERLKKATSTTEAPKEEIVEEKEIPRIRPPKLRGNISFKASENQDDHVETSTRRFKPRYTGQRHAYRTSTTQSPLLQLDTPSTTERLNTFRPSSQRRPGSNKYYSRYRTSTEPPGSADQPSTEKLPQRPKGVFSAKKRRPFPLRTRLESVTKPNTDESSAEPHSENSDNGQDTFITKKSDNVATTTLMTSSEEADWNVPSESSIKPEIFTLDSIDHGEITKKIADLTSSPSNSFDSSGFFKGVSPSSRRTVSQITLATEDPILPIEAFFSSSLNRNNDSR